ncbi:electron transfer flavoprotein subunit beta/FixA family protein [Undibacterium arcticum]|uniref:electron transfer flavoprotein subunit beta/FixA family protein n=1 Tax=Undibacterium arcticum TaxID=1762892 RepID=UPI00361E59C6
MNHSLKIAVLVSHARHPVSGRPLRSASDAAALELACSLALPERLTVLCAGSASADDLRDYLGLGAASIEVLAVPAEADVVPALLARLSGFDLVLCGNRSEGQTASGLLPYLLAEGLRMPLIADVLEATLQGRLLTVRQFLPKGMRRRLEMSAPAILAVHPRAPQTRQFAHARAAVGRITQTTGGGHSGNIAASAWQYEPARRPVRSRPRWRKAAIAGCWVQSAAIAVRAAEKSLNREMLSQKHKSCSPIYVNIVSSTFDYCV